MSEAEATRAGEEAEAKARAEAEAQLGPDGKFKSAELEAAYEQYVARKLKAGQTPRSRVDWKVARDYWLTDSPMARGNRFNETRAEAYGYNEVHLENGKRLDSYRPPEAGQPGEIVSRKATDFDAIEPETFDNYLKEMKNKYEPGTKIRSDKYETIDGQRLQGKQVLEVPDSNLKATNREAFEAAAKKRGITIKYAPE